MDRDSKEYRAYRREISRRHRQKHYDKIYARSVTKDIPHKPCEQCKLLGIINLDVEAHHYLGYKQPYKVVWLCKTHHEEADTQLAREGKEG